MTIHSLRSVDADDFARVFEQALVPQLSALGIRPLARLVTEAGANNLPRLPVREHDRAFLWLARWRNAAEEAAWVARFTALSGRRDLAPARCSGLRRRTRFSLQPADEPECAAPQCEACFSAMQRHSLASLPGAGDH